VAFFKVKDGMEWVAMEWIYPLPDLLPA